MKKLFTHIIAVSASAAIMTSLQAQTPGGSETDGIHLTKTVENFDYSTFEGRIRMESFVEGELKIVTETQPQDIVLVLDVSTSMNNNLVSYSYSARSSQSYTYSNYGTNTFFYLHDDGKYYQVRRSGTSNNRRL